MVFNNKKAQGGIGLTTNEILGLILFVLVIFVVFAVFMNFLGIFSTKIDQQTASFFNQFLEGTNVLADSSQDACYIQGSMDSDWGLLMFDAAKPTLWQKCGGDEEVDKPSTCGGKRSTAKGCVCVCPVGGGGADDDDCSEKGTKCFKVDKFKAFKYPDHNAYDDDEFGWWTGMSSGWVGGISWAEGHIYAKDCGGSVWASGTSQYVLKKSGTNLLIKRVPTAASGNKVSLKSLNISSCRALYQKLRQESGGLKGLVKS